MKQKKTIITILALIVILAIIITSIIIIKNKDNYNNYEIEKIVSQGYTGYRTKIFVNNAQEPFYVNTRYHPDDLDEISYPPELKETLNKNKIYVTITPNQNLTGKTTIAALEINNMIEPVFNVEVLSALTQDIGNNMTIKSCEDVNKTEGVIWLRIGEENEILTENNCVIIQGKTQDDLIKGADLLDFILLGIIK
ncbi:MAG: hypothetical protein PHG05_04665 [Candidatus Nanoarchaeia archaeon]|nr:hypothetical protein [Candidatus Nanoarchaeia archaeon]